MAENAEKPLDRLPPNVLDQLILLVAAEPGGSRIRCTCRWLHDTFDRCNTRLALKAAGQPPDQICPDSTRARVLELVRRSQHVSTVVLKGSMTPAAAANGLALHEVLAAGGQPLLQRLERLCFKYLRNLTDLKAIAACRKLQILEMDDCSIESSILKPLSACPVLHHLDLEGCTNIDNLAPLSSLTALRHLNLTDCIGVKDLGPLEGMQLQHLVLIRCAKVDDLGPLGSCVALHHLNLSGCINVEHLAPLAGCTALDYLILQNCSLVVDLTPLAKCVQLQTLNLRNCNKVESVKPLAACTALENLFLESCTKLTSVDPLTACGALKRLVLRECTDQAKNVCKLEEALPQLCIRK